MIIYAPAKVNLYLRVLRTRRDGYHDIETIFEKIALFDTIILRSLKKNTVKIFCDRNGVPTDEKSLIYRTIDMVRRGFRITKGVEVKIFKKIPIAAGLGGGSSDAAAVLQGLDRIWRLSADRKELIKYGKRLGADIPFFLDRGSFAVGRDRGDRIAPLAWKNRLWHILISPPIKVLSRDVYAQYAKGASSHLTKESYINKILFPGRRAVELKYLKRFIGNDLERVVLNRAPVIRRLKEVLNTIGVADSLVSGSGPSVFALFEQRKEAQRAGELLKRRFPRARGKKWQIFIVPTL